MKNKIFVIILSLLICVTALVGPLSPLEVEACYYTSVNSISDPQIRNAFKIWSVALCAGMTKAEAAGIIGNAMTESSADGTVLEGKYSDPYTIDVDWKRAAIADLCYYTRYTTFPAWKNQGYEIKPSSDRYGHSVQAYAGDGHHTSINTSAYVGLDGHYLPGIGVFQFTGPGASRLIRFANDISKNWWDIDTQLIYTFSIEGENIYGKAEWLLNNYSAHNYSTPEDCAYYFYWVFEAGKSDSSFNVNSTSGSSSVSSRKSNARTWYDKFENCGPDKTYGFRILKEARYPIRYAGTDEIIDQSIMYEYIGRTLEFPQSNGFAFDITGEADDYAKTAATALLKAMPDYATNGHIDTSVDPALAKKYSLYDLFGSDIHWYRYYGESTKPIVLLDHFWSGISQGKEDDLYGDIGAVIDTIFYTSTTYLSCNVYSGRPTVLTVQSLNEGNADPRVSTSVTGIFTGGSYVAGSFFMSVAKGIVSLVSYLMGPRPIQDLRWVADFITGNEIWTTVAKPLVIFIAGLSIIFFILSIFGKAKNYTLGRSSLREVLKRFFIGVLALGIIFVLAARPGVFNDIIERGATIVDEVFNEVLTVTHTEDDVVGSTDGTKTTEAMLWRTAIFEPWCKGQFGYSYNELYTQYATGLSSGQNKMPQSILTPEQISALTGSDYQYSSATYTGDVVVPVGNNYYIRNWAAFLYSCQSKYHIDYLYTSGNKTPAAEINFPCATTTARDPSLFADTFRVIDAQMDISPQIYSSEKVLNNYTGAHKLQHHFGSQGRLMLVYAIILFVSFIPAIIMKLKNLALLFFTCIQAIFFGIKELAKEGTGLSEIPDKFKTYGINYALAALKLFILTILFDLLVGKSVAQTVLYGILAIAVYGLTYTNIRQGVSKARSTIKRGTTYIKNKF